MEYSDSEKLLRECDAGTKMAVASLDEVLDRVQDTKLKGLLEKSREHHEKLEKELHACLSEHGVTGKAPSPVAKGMSWMKTNMKVTMEEDPDSAIADVLTDGCNMGVKSLHRYVNQYQGADRQSVGFAKKLIDIEEELCRDLQEYLE